ncbi:MAG: energy transducer TonB [Thiomonas sp. 13-66-29]|jgi:protein TonB|nr:MAG: energy transducer TonB [Thiomonas sp. 13-66-29]
MSAVLHHTPIPLQDDSDARRWPLAAFAALLLEAALIGAVAWWSSRTAPTPPPPPMQIVLDAPKPAPKTVAPPAPKPPELKPIPKPVVKPLPKPVVHQAEPRPVQPPLPTPAPQPKLEEPPAPAPDTKPAMPVAALTPPAPPAPDVASIKATFEAALRSAIQAAVRYPQAARLMRMTGRTLVAFSFTDGRVSALRVVSSSGAPLLDSAAIAAVRDAAYPATPSELRGKTMSFQIWVHFRLTP